MQVANLKNDNSVKKLNYQQYIKALKQPASSNQTLSPSVLIASALQIVEAIKRQNQNLSWTQKDSQERKVTDQDFCILCSYLCSKGKLYLLQIFTSAGNNYGFSSLNSLRSFESFAFDVNTPWQCELQSRVQMDMAAAPSTGTHKSTRPSVPEKRPNNLKQFASKSISTINLDCKT